MLKHLLNKHRLEIFVVLFLIVVAILYFADGTRAQPPSGGYDAPAPLNPECEPGDDNCFVKSADSPFKKVSGVVQQVSIISDEDFVFGSTTLDFTDDQAARMFFDKDLAAFRVGSASATQWDANLGNIGIYSVAMGSDTLAKEAASFAMGIGSRAEGVASVAMGNDTASEGSYSVAMGTNTTASGIASFAMGDTTTASGDYSTAMGQNTTASGNYSTAMGGGGTTATGDYSFATGKNTQAYSKYSTAWGNYTRAGDPSDQNQARGSTAFGFDTEASNSYSTAWGESTKASGYVSTAFGGFTVASGDYSSVMGQNSTAQAYNSFVIGRYNEISGTTDSWISTEPLFVIGNGTSPGSPSNAMTVLKNGNVGIGTASPGSKLSIVGLPSYADDAAAATGGLVTGDLYQTDSTGTAPLNAVGILMVKQ